jgi:hypothetical protein
MKQLCMAARWLELFFVGWTLSTADMTRMGHGEDFPMIVERRERGRWHPDDYAYGPEESVVAKEVADYRAVTSHCEKIGFVEKMREARARIPGLQGVDPEKHLLPPKRR